MGGEELGLLKGGGFGIYPNSLHEPETLINFGGQHTVATTFLGLVLFHEYKQRDETYVYIDIFLKTFYLFIY